MIRILLADTQPITNTGIHQLLSSEPYLEVTVFLGNLTELQVHLEKGCDILMIDPYFEERFNLNDIKGLIGLHKTIVITNQLGQRDITDALDAGIRVYLSKNCSPQELLQAVRSAYNHEKFISRRTIKALFGDLSTDIPLDKIPPLTSRETEIINLIAQGSEDREIAQKLFLSYHTIRTHRKNISRKIGFTLKNSAQLVCLIAYLNDLF